ncbi:MAG TPA: PKD domain-containing protein [Chitinophagaceae bacterium]
MTKLTAIGLLARCALFLCILLITLPAEAQLRADFRLNKSGGCSPLDIAFTNATTGASANATFLWDLGNGNSSTLRDPGAIYREEKVYTITLTVTDGTQTSTKTATVTVYKKPTVDFASSSAKVCLPAPASFTVQAAPGDGYITNYYWDFGDGQTAQGWGSSMSHSYSYEQKPTVSLTVTNSYGCHSSINKPEALEVLPAINPVITPDKALLCSLEETVQFSNNSTGPGALSYSWDFGDGTRSTEKAPSKVYTRKGVYGARVTVTNTDGCSVTSSPVQVNAAYFNTDFTNQNLCREVRFNSTSYLYANSSRWTFGDGGTSSSTYSTSHVYPTAGTYSVTLINTYNACKDTVTKTIKVEDLVAYNSDIEVPALICKDNSVTFRSRSSVQPSASQWEFADGTTYNWSGQVWRSFPVPGQQTVKLTNTFGTCKETVTRTITVNDLPDLKGFVVDYGGVCGSPVTVQFRDTTKGAVKWQWSVSYYGGTIATTQTASYHFPTDGYYTVYLTVTNAAGCTMSTSKTLNITRPSVTIGYNYTSSTRGNYDCDSLTMTFMANTNQPITTYSWNLGDGTTSTEANPRHTYNRVGSYAVTLDYTTDAGCTGRVYYSVRVWDKPQADFVYSVPCGNTLGVQLSDRSNFSDSWKWEYGDGVKDWWGYANPVHHYPDTGKYWVRFINTIGHCADTAEKEIYVNPLPSYVRVNPGQTTCNGTRGEVAFTYDLLRISSGTWNFGDGTSIPLDTSVREIKHTYTRTGVYSVTLMGQGPNCTLYDTEFVKVLLKQQPVLTANKPEICANESINVQIGGLETNPYANNSEWGQYYTQKFEHENGAAFSGNMYGSIGWRYATYTGVMQQFQAGTTKLRAVISNPSGCADTTNYIDLKVNGPVAGYKIATNNLCYKSPFTFEDTSKSVTTTVLRTWQWDFGDGQTETRTSGGTVTHLYVNPGTYPVRLTVTDATGCTTTATQTANARGPKASFTASGLFVPNVPLNTTVTFYNNTTSWFSNSVSYLWNYGDGATSTNYQGSNKYTAPGTDTVTLIATDPSLPCADTARQVIYVKDFQTAFTFSTTYLTASSCPPLMVRINNLSVGFTRLKWDFGDGTVSENVYYPSHTYNKPGTYRITLYTYGYNGLTGTYVDSVVVKAPTAQLAADPLQGCNSLNVSLQAGGQNISAYTWDFGDGTVSGTQSTPTSYNYPKPGVYYPRLIVRDEKGCRTASELAEPVVVDDLRTAIKGIPSVLCDAVLVPFTADVASLAADRLQKPLTYHWDFGTGNPADTANVKNAPFSYTTPGTYTVRLKVTSPYGCMKETSETVTVLPTAKGTITGDGQTCEGGTVQFNGASSVAGNLQWKWTFGNGNTATGQATPAQVYPTPATYTVQLVLNNGGCYDTAFHTLTVHPKPVVTMNTRQALLCEGSSLQLSAAGGSTYAWTPAAGLNNSAVANPVASPLSHTTYKVQVTTEHGCSRTDSVAIRVAPRIDVKATADTYICEGKSVQLAATGATSYRWIDNTAGLNNPAIANPTAAPLSSTLYKVVGYDAHNCFTDTVAVRVDVQPRPTVSAGPDVEVPGGVPYQLQATGSGDITGWLWSPADHLSCSACPSPLATPRMQTAYVVEAKNAYGCATTDTVTLKLECAPSNVHIPDGFTPNRDGKNDVFYILGSGVNTIRHLRIYNRWGEIVFERRNFAIHDRAAGWDGRYKDVPVPLGTYVYLAEMECSSGEVITRKGTVTVFY